MSDQERLDALEAEGLKMHTREVSAWKLKLAQENARRRAELREAIAKDVLIALIHEAPRQLDGAPRTAVAVACELLDALDSAWLRDREATK